MAADKKTIGMVWAAILWYIKSASMVKRVDKMAVNEGRIFFALVQWGIPSFSLKALIKIVTDYIMTNIRKEFILVKDTFTKKTDKKTNFSP